MAKDSQQYTAFMVGSMGVYEFLRMPYGLCNMPVTFQRLMQNCLGELNLTYALIYLDNVIVFSQTEGGAPPSSMGGLRLFSGAWAQIEAVQMSFPPG